MRCRQAEVAVPHGSQAACVLTVVTLLHLMAGALAITFRKEEIPHIQNCNFCVECIVGDAPDSFEWNYPPPELPPPSPRPPHPPQRPARPPKRTPKVDANGGRRRTVLGDEVQGAVHGALAPDAAVPNGLFSGVARRLRASIGLAGPRHRPSSSGEPSSRFSPASSLREGDERALLHAGLDEDGAGGTDASSPGGSELWGALPHHGSDGAGMAWLWQKIGGSSGSSRRRRLAAKGQAGSRSGVERQAPEDDDPSAPPHLRLSSYYASSSDVHPKQTLPNCTVCYGCSTKLMPMNSRTAFLDRIFENEKGATSGWLFRATTNRTESGIAVAKAYCMPIAKLKGGRTPLCAPSSILRTMKLFLAIQRLSEDCGFQDIIPRVWVDKIDGVVPSTGWYQGHGYHIRWYGLWMEHVNGISMENFLHKGFPTRFQAPVIMDMFHNRINRTRITRAAIFDLLTSQCDRHAQNIFIEENGNIHLIDNEACMQMNWKGCGFDSVLLPTSQKQEIIRLSNQFVNKLVTKEEAPKKHADPQLLLDYRCWTENETIGTNYDPQIQQCLRLIAGLSQDEVHKRYGLPDAHTAYVLRSRATDMIERGFEWTYKYGKPTNMAPKRYRMQPKCCGLKHQQGLYWCNHTWDPLLEVPIGDPITGRAWTKARPDTGSYEGGTVF